MWGLRWGKSVAFGALFLLASVLTAAQAQAVPDLTFSAIDTGSTNVPIHPSIFNPFGIPYLTGFSKLSVVIKNQGTAKSGERRVRLDCTKSKFKGAWLDVSSKTLKSLEPAGSETWWGWNTDEVTVEFDLNYPGLCTPPPGNVGSSSARLTISDPNKEEINVGNNTLTIRYFDKKMYLKVGASETAQPSDPDLFVLFSVSEEQVAPSQNLNLSAIVENRGTSPSSSTTLRYYRSTDSDISPSDTEVGHYRMDGIAASAEIGLESKTVSVPSAPGTYYYGACVDAVSGESDPGNNCSAGVRVTVELPSGPELFVLFSTSEERVMPGQNLKLSAVVENRGTNPSSSTTLRYYRSMDPEIDRSDTEIGDDRVNGIAASEIGLESKTVSAPSAPGTYYYGACVDAVSGESDPGNNCSAGMRVTVGASPGPELFVLFSASEQQVASGQNLKLSAAIENRGASSSSATTLRYYRSTDPEIDRSDTEVGDDRVDGIAASEVGLESKTVSAPLASGVYYYGACVDAVSGESNPGNNCSVGVRVTVEPPDLVVQHVWVSRSDRSPGQGFRLSARAVNQLSLIHI